MLFLFGGSEKWKRSPLYRDPASNRRPPLSRHQTRDELPLDVSHSPRRPRLPNTGLGGKNMIARENCLSSIPSLGTSLFILFVFFDTNLCFIIYIGCNLRNTRRRGRRKAATTKTGPNVRRRLGHRYVFFKFFIVYYDTK